VSIQDKVSL